MSRISWDKRIRRAEQLAAEYPASAEILRFYAQIARFQEKVYERLKRQPVETQRRECLDADLPELVRLVQRVGPAGLSENLAASSFFERVLLQPYMECVADGHGAEGNHCPACGDRPLAAVLRGEGDGGKRWLLCSLCSNEWEFRRVLCPNCSEKDKDRLPVYTAEPFNQVRVEACDSCRTYIKSIDLTKNGLAIPCVDELASVALDLWAAEAGYTKLQRNIMLL
jgi:FdhE protein